MRSVSSLAAAAVLCLAGQAGLAQESKDCARSAELVQTAVEARKSGDPMDKTRDFLRAELDEEAGDMLADFIYALPEEQLTDQVAAQWGTLCQSL